MDEDKVLEIAANIAGDLLAQLGLEAELNVQFVEHDSADQTKKYIQIHYNGENLGEVIGFSGQNLDALQVVFALMINKAAEVERNTYRVLVDVNDYKEMRERQLQSYATKEANRAKEIGGIVELKPMKPFERRIVHMVLKEMDGIETYSEGEGRERHIVIKAAANAADSELF